MDWKNCNNPLLEITLDVIYVVARNNEKKSKKKNKKRT